MSKSEIPKMIAEMESEMYRAAEELNFEKAIELREAIDDLKRQL